MSQKNPNEVTCSIDIWYPYENKQLHHLFLRSEIEKKVQSTFPGALFGTLQFAKSMTCNCRPLFHFPSKEGTFRSGILSTPPPKELTVVGKHALLASVSLPRCVVCLLYTTISHVSSDLPHGLGPRGEVQHCDSHFDYVFPPPELQRTTSYKNPTKAASAFRNPTCMPLMVLGLYVSCILKALF